MEKNELRQYKYWKRKLTNISNHRWRIYLSFIRFDLILVYNNKILINYVSSNISLVHFHTLEAHNHKT